MSEKGSSVRLNSSLSEGGNSPGHARLAQPTLPNTAVPGTSPSNSQPSPQKRVSRRPENITKIDVRVGSKFRVLEKLGEGGFGEIYRGMNIITQEMVAIKLEPLEGKHQHLLPEARLYKMLGPDGPRGSRCDVGSGIPRVHWYGLEGDYYVMVIDMLGPSLEDVFNFCYRKFSLKTVIHLGIQMLSRIEHVHSKHVIHRDVKPDNFLLGVGNKGTSVYIIDFGLAKPYRCPRTYQHIQYRTRKHMLGTARYASLNTHLGQEQSRRDDLEAIAYILFYFLRGSLPWQGALAMLRDENGNNGGNGNNKVRRAAPNNPKDKKKENKKKYQLIKEMKLAYSASDLGKGYPREFQYILEYTRGLGFKDKPNYAHLRSVLSDLREKQGISKDLVFEWSHACRGVHSEATNSADHSPTHAESPPAVMLETPALGMPCLEQPEGDSEADTTNNTATVPAS